MCDTVVVVRAGAVLFGKNSNRDPNEAQRLEWVPRAEHAPGALVRCTWRSIPQVGRTHALLLSRPFWMWGAEMGANEHGVVIGNEAVFTRVRSEPDGLLGMDLVRLGLERAAGAAEAVEVIASLVARYGQGGRAGYDAPGFHYDSSFLVADAREAWVLETAGRKSARERVTAGVRAISNALTIAGFARGERRLLPPLVARARARRARVSALAADAVSPRDVAHVLRDHGPHATRPRYRWLNGALAAPCAHAGGIAASTQTVASWISLLRPDGAEHYATATAAPCLSAWKPVAFRAPQELGAPSGIDDGQSAWWRFERLHRALAADPNAAAAHVAARDRWEAATWDGSRAPEDAFEAWSEFVAAAEARMAVRTPVDARPAFVQRYWAARARDAAAAVSKLPAR